ncbi:MAG: hypothetical protein ABSD61_00345 [Terracidiphilus sp.]|jgi:hypothetical protein
MDREDWEFALGAASFVLALFAFFGLDWKVVSGEVKMPHLNIRNTVGVILILCGLAFSGLGWYQYRHSSTGFDANSQLEVITDKVFINQAVELDGKDFRNCEFQNVTLMFHGRSHFSLEYNKFAGVFLTSDNPSVIGAWELTKGLGMLPGLPILGPDGKPVPNVSEPLRAQ